MLYLLYYSLITLPLLVIADQPNATLQSTYINSNNCTFTYYTPAIYFSFLGCDTPAGDSNYWHECINRCCLDSSGIDENLPSLFAIVQCKNSSGSSGTSVAVIIMGVAIGIFGLVVILCFCVVACRIVRNRHSRTQIVYNAEEISQVQWPQQKQITNSLSNIKWSKHAAQTMPLKRVDTPCSICLDENTNAELVCHHQYHPNCIGKWFKKSSACPCCRHENIKGVKVYCQSCRWRYIVCSAHALMTQTTSLSVQCRECGMKRGVGSEQVNEYIEVMPKESGQAIKQQISHQNLMEIQTFVFDYEQLE